MRFPAAHATDMSITHKAVVVRIREHADATAIEAWHVALAIGIWPIRQWLREAVAEWELTGVDVKLRFFNVLLRNPKSGNYGGALCR